ncbi:MAG: hypothetical protein AMXMBFR46_05250 [Acidimicrobiia bacterium]
MGAESFQKRERERKRQERASERRQRREARSEAEAATPPVDTDALMEQFRVLSERHASGAVDDATYEAERNAIFVELGLADPLAG